jgi:hypothetical protein
VSLEDLGNIGDLVAAIGVVISLVYLAVQIRQNTRQLAQNTGAARLAALEATNREFNVIRNEVVRDPEVADLYLRGLREFGSLEPRDRLRFGLLLQNFFFTFQATFDRSAELGGPFGASHLDAIVRHPGARDWWNQAKPGFSPAFVQFIEKRIARLASRVESAAQQGAAADRQGPHSDQPR